MDDKKANYFNEIIYYIPLFCILKWIEMYKNIRTGLLISVILFFYMIKIMVKNKIKLNVNTVTKLILLYIIYNIFTIIVSLLKGYPFSLICSELANTIFPMIFFFIGKQISEELSYKFEKVFTISCFVIFIIGIYYNLTLSDKAYLNFLEKNNHDFNLHGFMIIPRLNAMLGSVVCGVMGCIGICFSFNYLFKKKNIAFCFSFIFCFLLAIFTLQRSAMVCAILNSIMLIIYSIRKGYMKFVKVILSVTIAIVVALIINEKYSTMWKAIFERYDSVSTAYLERNNGWKNAFKNDAFSTAFGYGFATGGQRAIGLSNTTVNDGNYFKILYENGLIGLFIFFGIIIKTLTQKNKKIIYTVAFISCLLQMIGSNIITFQITTSLFWYILGRMNINEDIKERKNK